MKYDIKLRLFYNRLPLNIIKSLMRIKRTKLWFRLHEKYRRSIGGHKYGGFTHDELSKIQSFQLIFFQCVYVRYNQWYSYQNSQKGKLVVRLVSSIKDHYGKNVLIYLLDPMITKRLWLFNCPLSSLLIANSRGCLLSWIWILSAILKLYSTSRITSLFLILKPLLGFDWMSTSSTQ